jgi:hypothetical protein
MLVLDHSRVPDSSEASCGDNNDIGFRDCRIHKIRKQIAKFSLFIDVTLKVDFVVCLGKMRS